MKIITEGSPQEIAALVLAIQEKKEEKIDLRVPANQFTVLEKHTVMKAGNLEVTEGYFFGD